MRMRLLGQGHTICFWASEEADNGIRELSQKTKTESIFTKDVFDWICYNSRIFERDGLVHWSAAAYNYTQKLAAYQHVRQRITGEDDMALLLPQLSDRCTDKEIVKLSDLYGEKDEFSIVSIFKHRFSNLITRYTGLYDSKIEAFLESKSDFVIKRLEEHIPNVARLSQMLDEEQEKELEYELEEQRELQRPGKGYAAEPRLDKDLEALLRHGVKSRKYLNELTKSKGLLSLPKALRRTSLWSGSSNKEINWGNEIYATQDFMNVVTKQDDMADEFLRPVWWIVSATSSEPTTKQLLILMSPFEANCFLHIFRENPSTTLRMYSPRLNPDPSINTMINCKSLQMPFNSDTSDIDGLIESQLSLFSGTIYFNNKLEMENYCTFLGIIPSPFTQQYQKAFDKGLINFNGFVRPQHRHICENLRKSCPFKKNPDKLVRQIIERRHGFLPKNSHVAKIVIEGTIAGIKYGHQS